MARRRSRSGTRKSEQEARVERLTWFALIMVFIALSFDDNNVIPGFAVPFATAFILFFSGFYQYRQLDRGWRASAWIWVLGTLMAVAGGFTVYNEVYRGVPSIIDPVLVALIGTVTLIVNGILTNEG